MANNVICCYGSDKLISAAIQPQNGLQCVGKDVKPCSVTSEMSK